MFKLAVIAAGLLCFSFGTSLIAAPDSAQFVSKSDDPRGGDAGYNTFRRLPDGKGIAFAGFSHDPTADNSVAIYDPVTDTWQIAVPNNHWIDTYDVSERTFLGNRDDNVALVVDGGYWALDGERGIDLSGNWRGVLDTQTWQWQIDDDPSRFGPTGGAFGTWENSAAGWIPVLDSGYIFGGSYGGNPADRLATITRNAAGSVPPFSAMVYFNEWGDPSFIGAELLDYISNQHWVRGTKIHVYGGIGQDRDTGSNFDSSTLWQIDVTTPQMNAFSINDLPDDQRVQGGALLGYYDSTRDMAVVTNGVLVNVYDYTTSTWINVPVLTPSDPDRESPSSAGAGRAAFYSPEIDQMIILGGHSRVYGLRLNYGDTTCAMDVSAQVHVTRSRYFDNLATGHYAQTVTFENPTSGVIAGPISLVLDELSSNTMLLNLSGTTACALPSGRPYINLPDGLNPGASASVGLVFTDPTFPGITYATRVLSGSATR